MAKNDNLKDFLTDVADAIREKKGTTDLINPQDFSDEIKNLPSGGDIDALVARTITEYESDVIESVSNYAFYDCSEMTRVSAPNVKTILDLAFAYCTALSSIDFPHVENIALQAFYECRSLASVNTPNLSYLKNQVFRSCRALKRIELNNCTNIGSMCFFMSGITTLILGAPTVCTLGHTDAFAGTPIVNGTGYIYVPDDLVEAYKGATNWSTFASQIKGLSELPEE